MVPSMVSYNHNKGITMCGQESAKELWAVVNSDGEVMYSRGGSSSKPKLMVYPTEAKAKAALSSPWTKQVMDGKMAQVVNIYSANKIS